MTKLEIILVIIIRIQIKFNNFKFFNKYCLILINL